SGSGLIQDLVDVENEVDPLSDQELLAMVFLLLAAGHETTVHLICNAILVLLENQNLRHQLANDESLLSPFVDEVLRYCTPVQITKPRYVAKDTVFERVNLNKGELVIGLLASANYDPARFDDPCVFDLQRQRNQHLAFGMGPHICLGMRLAKLECMSAIKALLDKWPDPIPAFELSQADWSKRLGMRSLKSLVISSS
ncbi:MAG: cytochrome P450, partial [Planctomycetota bacterium]